MKAIMSTPAPDESINGHAAGSDDAGADSDKDGGDVPRDPDVIQREIEQTRAELADTIDAIADRISPKRAASRGATAVKDGVSSVLHRGSSEPASVLDAPAADSSSGPRAIEPGSGGYTGTTQYSAVRQLRTDRVLIAVGVAAAVTAVVIWRRRS